MAGPSDSSCSPTAFPPSYLRTLCQFDFQFSAETKHERFNCSQYADDPTARAKPPQAEAPFSTQLQSSSTRPSPLAFILLLLLLLAVVSLPLLSPQNMLLPPAEPLSCAQHTAQMLSSPFSHPVCMSDFFFFFFQVSVCMF